MKIRLPFTMMKKGTVLCFLISPYWCLAALSLIQKSEPSGLFSQSTDYFDYNDTFLTRTIPETTGGYAFTHWEINGNRTDIPDVSIALQVTGQITENTVAVAKYIIMDEDSDQDGIKDWFEIRTLGSLNYQNGSDDDNDSIPLDKEYKFGLNPNSHDQINEGGISIRRSNKVFLNLGGARKLQVRSDPPGLVASQSSFPEVNSTYNSPNLNGIQGGYYFSHWEVNGERMSDLSGKALSKISDTMNQDKEVVARFFEQSLDADNDKIPDWYEWHEFGTLDFNNQSNPDEDLYNLEDERKFGLNGNIKDTIQEGGISVRRSSLTKVNLGGGSFVKITSDPPGMLSTQYMLQEKNSTYQSASLNGQNGNFVFSHWEINGVRQSSASGIALSRVIEKLDTDKTIVAKYFDQSTDLDNDKIPDWYENQQFGGLALSGNSDPDMDGFSNEEEIRFGLSPLINDQFFEGGIALRRSKTVSYVKDLSDATISFDSDGDGLSDKEEEILGSNATLVDTDADGYSDHQEFLAGSNLLDAKSFPNQSPSAIYLSNNEVEENSPVGIIIGTFSVSDPNPNSFHQVTLLDQNDSGAEVNFFIDENNTLRTGRVLDFEKNQSVEITVRAIDEGNLSIQKSFLINIKNIIEDLDDDGIEDAFDLDIDGDGFSNEEEVAFGSDPLDSDSLVNKAPTELLLSNSQIEENLPVRSLVGNFIGFDTDENSALSYHLVEDKESLQNDLFVLKQNGTLLTNDTFDYENESNFTLKARVVDEFNASFEKLFFIKVIDVFEEPIDRLPIIRTEGAIKTGKDVIQMSGFIIEPGDFKIEEVGFVIYSDNDQSEMVIADLNEQDSSFELELKGLKTGIHHHFQTYAKTSFGNAYGIIKKFIITDTNQAKPWWSQLSENSVNGWLVDSWIGNLMPFENNWAFHRRLGWIYMHNDKHKGFWIWKAEFGWVWTKADVWPFIWSDDSADWIYLIPFESEFLFYDYSTGSLR